MTRPWSCVGVTLCCLFAVASSVSADCAWVLWKDSEYNPGRRGPVEKSLKIISAHNTKQECDAQSYAAWQERRRIVSAIGFIVGPVPDPGSVHGNKTESDGTATSLTEQYTCLPDTVDPRGAKPSSALGVRFAKRCSSQASMIPTITTLVEGPGGQAINHRLRFASVPGAASGDGSGTTSAAVVSLETP